MNDTDIYADKHRVDYHPQTDPVLGGSPGLDPGGHGLDIRVRNRGEAG